MNQIGQWLSRAFVSGIEDFADGSLEKHSVWSPKRQLQDTGTVAIRMSVFDALLET